MLVLRVSGTILTRLLYLPRQLLRPPNTSYRILPNSYKSYKIKTMLIHTTAIVLHHTHYNDQYTIVHFYTLTHGRLGVLVPKKTHKTKKHHILLTRLAEVDLLVELKPQRELAFFREAHSVSPHYTLQVQPTKCSQAIFLSELLYRVLTLPSSDSDLYEYLSTSLNFLDSLDKGVANFYLCFSLYLLRFLAIAPDLRLLRRSSGKYFNLSEACYTNMTSGARHLLPSAESQHLRLFSRITYRNLHYFQYSRAERGRILDWLMLYYQLHLPSFSPLKSIPILRAQAQKSIEQDEKFRPIEH